MTTHEIYAVICMFYYIKLFRVFQVGQAVVVVVVACAIMTCQKLFSLKLQLQ
jgi:hypothetical protein